MIDFIESAIPTCSCVLLRIRYPVIHEAHISGRANAGNGTLISIITSIFHDALNNVRYSILLNELT